MTGHGWGGRPQLLAFVAHTVLVQAVTFVLRPASTYRALELDVPAQWLGVLAASFAVVPLVLAIPSGQAVDRLGERRVMLAGAVLLLTSAVGFRFGAGTVLGLVLATVVLGVGHLCSVVGQQALVANRTPARRYDAAFGHYTFATSAGQAVGPGLILLFGGEATIPHTASIFSAGIWLTAAVVVLTGLLPAGGRAARAPGREAGALGVLLRRPGLVRALVVSCVVLSAVDITLVYLPALGADRGIAAGTVGVLLAVRAVASMGSRFFLGRLVDLLGRRRLLLVSIGLSAVAMGLTCVPMPVRSLGVVVLCLGLGLGAGQPLTMAWLAEAAPPGLRGRAMSLRLTGNRLGQVLLPSAAGLLAVGTGPPGVLAATAAGLAVAGLAARSLNRRGSD